MLAVPVQAQLIIPATTGAEACTQGSLVELQPTAGLIVSATANAVSFDYPILTNSKLQEWGDTSNDFTSPKPVRVELLENRPGSTASGGGQLIGNISSESTTIPAGTVNNAFGGLKKNTRYVLVLYSGSASPLNPLIRRCFKTRGEFTNAEQNLFLDGSEWKPNLTQYNRTGCYAVASTRQDIRDCYCNGKRNGTHILAGQTVASQAQRQYLNCPNLDS